MTRLHKAVKRTVALVPKGGGARLEVVVTLYPGGVIGLRDKGRRKEYTLPLATVYYLAADAEARRIMAERKANKAAKRKEHRKP